jgi:uncharacterized repeat protein (TIGR03803 family)
MSELGRPSRWQIKAAEKQTIRFHAFRRFTPVLLGLIGWIAPHGLACAAVIHDFLDPAAGSTPAAPVIMDSSGALYGTTFLGGAANCGTIYRLAPTTSGSTTAVFLMAMRGLGKS